MTPENFREALCRFGDHPDRIAELRKVAVGLAIAGHWKAGADMRCAADLAGAIEAEKASLVGAGAISKPKTYLPVRADDLPDVLKNSSTFVPLGQIARIEKGQTGIKQAVPGDYPLVVTAAKRSSCDHFDFEGAAAVVPLVSATGHGNASINRLHYQEGKFALGTILAAVFPYAPEIISARFLFEYLSTFKDELLVSRMTGTANVTLTISRIAEVPVPLISPEVQGRLDAFMALCDQLKAARAEREAGRDRLTAATLARLNAPDPETFPADARFALDNLIPLTTRLDQIKQLRQTILNLAVRGKLVEQDPADGSGLNFMAALPIKEQGNGRGRRTIAVRKVEPSEEYLDIPDNWTWARIHELGVTQTGTSPSSANPGFFGDFMPFIKPGDLDGAKISYEGPGLSEEGVGQSRLAPAATVLMVCIGATLGKVNITDRNVCFNQQINSLTPYLPGTSLFLALALKGAGFQKLAWSKAGTGTLPIISKGKWEILPVPVPPLAEQHRIVAKVDELMALCDQLEASITKTEHTRSRLLECALHNALEPA